MGLVWRCGPWVCARSLVFAQLPPVAGRSDAGLAPTHFSENFEKKKFWVPQSLSPFLPARQSVPSVRWFSPLIQRKRPASLGEEAGRPCGVEGLFSGVQREWLSVEDLGCDGVWDLFTDDVVEIGFEHVELAFHAEDFVQLPCWDEPLNVFDDFSEFLSDVFDSVSQHDP